MDELAQRCHEFYANNFEKPDLKQKREKMARIHERFQHVSINIFATKRFFFFPETLEMDYSNVFGLSLSREF